MLPLGREKLPQIERKKNLGRFFKLLMFVTASSGAVGCVVQSPDPEVQDIIKVSAPTFQGKTNAFFSSPNQDFVVEGECDMSARSHEVSYDKSSWTKIDCIGGRFQVPIKIVSFIDLYARSWGKFSPSDISRARSRFALPPTSPIIVAGNSTKSDSSDAFGRGTQNMMASSFGAAAFIDSTATSATVRRVQLHLPRMAYEK